MAEPAFTILPDLRSSGSLPQCDASLEGFSHPLPACSRNSPFPSLLRRKAPEGKSPRSPGKQRVSRGSKTFFEENAFSLAFFWAILKLNLAPVEVDSGRLFHASNEKFVAGGEAPTETGGRSTSRTLSFDVFSEILYKMHQFRSCLRLARPHQYIKNGFIWLPVFFANKINDVPSVLHAFWAFLAFCLLASGVYALNDIRDVKEDREHPTKKNRPLASGELSVTLAAVFAAVLCIASFSLSYALLPAHFIFVLAAYVLLNLGYSYFLKHVAIVDVVCIAVGFVLRVQAGAIAANVPVSQWIVIMTFLLALFLALGKRRDDLLLSANGCNTRKCLDGYNLEFVSAGMVVMTSVVIVAYILYCVSPEVAQKHGTKNLYLTGFWVILGLLRYLQITFVEERSGAPSLIIAKDYFLLAVLGCWILTFYWLIYGFGS